MTKRPKNAIHKGMRSQDTDVGGWGTILAIFLIVGFVVAVVVNYYLWSWIAPVFGWPEIGFWWFVPITLVWVPIKFIFEGLIYSLFCSKDS